MELLRDSATPMYLQRKICTHKNVYTGVHRSVIHVNQSGSNSNAYQLMNIKHIRECLPLKKNEMDILFCAYKENQ